MGSAKRRFTHSVVASLVCAGAGLLGGCDRHPGSGEAPSLSLGASHDEALAVPVPPANGPKVGALLPMTPVLARPAADARSLGWLHTGALVPRGAEPYPGEGCPGGWFPIRPRGFVCAGPSATLDVRKPLLLSHALRPDLGAAMPYAYARTTQRTALLEPGDAGGAVRRVGDLPRGSGLAIVGSWTAPGEDGEPVRLGMTTTGRFVDAEDLRAADDSDFVGTELDASHRLPLAWVVKRGVRFWKLASSDEPPQKLGLIAHHERCELTGRFRTIDGVRFWALADGRWVRAADVTVAPPRHVFPEFATGTARWADLSVVTGVLVLYEGTKAVFATLASVGRDRAVEGGVARTKTGTHRVVEKIVTDVGSDPKSFAEGVNLYDVPWVLRLSSGQEVHGAYWHDEFGVEHGPGSIELSPPDARRMWLWSTPELPDGWHAVSVPDSDATMVLVRD